MTMIIILMYLLNSCKQRNDKKIEDKKSPAYPKVA